MREHVLVADGEDGVLPVDGHQAGVRLQDDVRMSVLFVSGMKKQSPGSLSLHRRTLGELKKKMTLKNVN